MINRRYFVSQSAAAAAALALSPTVFAQPAGKVVRMVVPLPAGGSSDALARAIAEKLRGRYAATVIVDNRVGGGGRIGVENVKNSEADGSVLLFTPDFPITLYPSLYKKMPYELKDLQPVASCAVTSFALTAGPGLPAQVKTVADLVQWAKANPKLAAFASPSAGSTPHFTGMMLNRAAGMDMLHVPYKGGALAVQDIMGGQVPMGFNPIGEILQYAKAGKLRVLATTGPTRSRYLPDVPTLAESYKDLVVQSWLGMLVPAATPAPVVAKLNADLMDVIKEPDFVESLAKFGFEVPAPSSAAAFAAVARADVERWGGIIRATGFTAEE